MERAAQCPLRGPLCVTSFGLYGFTNVADSVSRRIWFES